MSLLPDGAIDTLGVSAAIDGATAAVTAALAAPLEVTPRPVDGIVIVASGDDAQVAEAARVLVTEHSPIPVVVHSGYGLPGFVTEAWQCVFVSHADSVEAASALDRTVEAAESVAVGDGPIVDAVAAAGGAVFRLPTPVAPRFGFAAALVATLRLLESYGALLAPVGDGDVASFGAAAGKQLAARTADLDSSGLDRSLARRIGRTIPLVYGSGAIGAVAAGRWKDQVNDNAKAPAFANSLPAVLHHELSGWGQHGDMTRQVFTFVTLRHDHEHPRDFAAMPTVEALLEEVTADRHEVSAAGSGALAQLLDLVHVGDRVSFHLAQENEIDPGPTSVDAIV